MVFLVIIFFLKTEILDDEKPKNENLSSIDGSMLIQDLVNKDTDGDGVLDWEESLWGTDPTKKDTNDDGILDDIEIENLKKQKRQDEGEEFLLNEESLSQTDKLSRELFSIVAELNQAGVMDQATVDKLSSSLIEQIQNSNSQKIYTISDIKTANNDTSQSIQKYNDTLNNIYIKTPIKKGILVVLQEFMADGKDNINILSELDPAINQIDGIINELLKMSVPQSLSLLHLNLINTSKRILENTRDMKLFDTDTIVALSAISQYEKNVIALELAGNKLTEAIKRGLSN